MILHSVSGLVPPTLGALGRMSLHLFSTCLFFFSHLSATLGALDRMSLQFTLVSHTRLPHLPFTLVSHSGCLGPHEFTRVFHLSPTLVSHSGCLGPHEFTLVSHLFPQTGLPVWGSYSSQRVAFLGRMSLHSVSHTCHPTLGALGRMILHLFSTCLSHLSATLGVFVPHEFTVYTCLPHSSPTLAFHTCLAIWVPWAA